MLKRALLIVTSTVASGCQPVLKPDYAYPQGWPALTVQAEGFEALEGLYANDGVATTARGGTVPVQLGDLLPQGERLRATTPGTGATAGRDTVMLDVVPATGLQPFPRLRATVTTGDELRICEVQSGTGQNALLYDLQVDGRSAAVVGYDAGLMHVTLTAAADGSLVARISPDTSGVTMVVPSDTRADVWARFERINP